MEALLKHIGDTVIHVTAKSNLPAIRKHGLHPAAELAKRAGIDPHDIILRANRKVLQTDIGECTLNHQLPILHGTAKQGQSLDGISREDWAHQLDQRVFLWPKARGEAFAKSIQADTDIATIRLNARALFQRYPEQIDLCPINSGNFRQGGANTLRGKWIYVSASAGLDAFRNNRKARGLVKSTDSVREISMRGAISADAVNEMWIEAT